MQTPSSVAEPELSLTHLQTLLERALVVDRERLGNLARQELERLKFRAGELEREGRFDEAIRIWRDYHGDYRDDLRDEIRRQVEYLEKRQRLREDGLE